MFKFLKNLLGINTIDLQPVLKKDCVIIDVRSAAEYNGGHIEQSINIPLQNIANEISKIKKHQRPVITCCASGIRSQRALATLKTNGIEAYNGGGWKSLQKQLEL